MILFSVTVIDQILKPGSSECRVVAICESLERAEKIITNNIHDIHERCYQYAVIEMIETNVVYPTLTEYQRWYEWKDNGYQEIERPPETLKISGWGI